MGTRCARSERAWTSHQRRQAAGPGAYDREVSCARSACRHCDLWELSPNRLEECRRRRRDIAVHEHLAGRVQHADIHGLHVEINSALVTVLVVVESHRSSSCAVAHLPCASLLAISRYRGRAE